jgi:uncharacterized protein (DUF2336 family)
MDNDIFEKSPQVTPLLVRLYDSHKIYGLHDEHAPEARKNLTDTTAELLETELEFSEKELLADVLINLLKQAEHDLRQALAERLSTMPDVPLRLVLHLANDEITVAAPVLRRSPVLSDLDLIYIIKSKGADYWQAIAARETLSSDVIDILAETNDKGTAIVLAKNDRITLTRHAVKILAELAKQSDVIAKPLILRPEIPEDLARQLYKYVGQELKDLIKGYYGMVSHAAIQATDDVILEFTESQAANFMPSEEQLKIAGEYARKGRLNLQEMMETLKKGQLALFIALFSKYSGVKASHIHDIIRQSDSKNLAVLCRAFNILKGDFSTIYMMTQRIRSKDRIVDQKELLSALAIYDRIHPEEARKALGVSE